MPQQSLYCIVVKNSGLTFNPTQSQPTNKQRLKFSIVIVQREIFEIVKYVD